MGTRDATGGRSGAMTRRARPELPEGPYLIVGLARSGVAAALALRGRGEQVLGVDAGAPAGARVLAEAGVELHLNQDGVALLEKAKAVVKSPGVPAQAPAIEAARARGLPVLGELELGWRMLANEFVAVTGTNGKTTTVELIGHIHREAGLPVAVAGNVGAAVSGLVGSGPGLAEPAGGRPAGDRVARGLPALGGPAAGVDPCATIVCEVSSFQLEDTLAFAPEAAVLLNLTPDHLDRHGTFEAYRDAKLQIFVRQGNDDIAVAPLGLESEIGIPPIPGCARRVCFGEGPGAALALSAGELWWQERALMRVDELRLPGEHNVQNAMAAAAVCLARGIEEDAVRAGLRSFSGVAHRLEEVASRDGVRWVNDSKATNVASTVVALEAFGAGTIHLILGGRGKGQDFSALRDPVQRTCGAVYLIGEDAPKIAAALAGVDVPVHEYGDLERAVSKAREAARPGDVVLLSPACASFDQFADYEARGERFRELVPVGEGR
jgi:UDP-N-acetylmuramoylalanine--D-glutamate ligase